jgi:hypothetical protein
VPDWSFPGGSKGVSFRFSQVAESYEVGTHWFRWSANYSIVTSGLRGMTTGGAVPRYHMIKSLRVENFRFFKEVSVPDLQRVNVVVGKNATDGG